ncbi:hypothetical protein I6B53_04390 [Schaalia sp. 19OD2882]|uniref:hypothetical protein n=1 Tax=Schaalia sp. 19OD2882 TaxID=2794089 RepID=UPI001C1E9E6A|nr:hypothetical protein [Schaalia sp. 19OD2882]QWW20333.1 hypothetical protein I6B53_04390 [Schaalia sp. 19OD2882]
MQTPEPPTRRYLARMGAATGAYVSLLTAALALSRLLPGAWASCTLVLVLPAVPLFVRAVRLLWAESDEFARTQMQEAMALGFCIGAPILCTAGLLEIVAKIHVPFIASFGIVMVAWAMGAAISARKYR